MRGRILKIAFALIVGVVFMTPLTVDASSYSSMNVGYQSLASNELQDFAYGGALSGSEGGSPLQAVSLHLVDAPNEAKIEYRVYTANGWSAWFKNYEMAQSNAQNLLGVQIRLANIVNSNVYYQSYRKDLGWGDWVKNGATSGQLDAAHPITGLRVQVDELGVQYQSNVGGTMQVIRHNRETQGSGLIYTVKMGLISSYSDQKIEYRAYFKNGGWSNWASNMTSIGSERSGDVVTALEAKLINLPGYHVRIQPQVNGDWWDWSYDGATAGTFDTPLTAYRVEVVKDKAVVAVVEPEVTVDPTPDPTPEQDPGDTDPFADTLGALGEDDLRIVLTWYYDETAFPYQDYDLNVSERTWDEQDSVYTYVDAYYDAPEYLVHQQDVIPNDDPYYQGPWQEVVLLTNINDRLDSTYYIWVENYDSWESIYSGNIQDYSDFGKMNIKIYYGTSGELVKEVNYDPAVDDLAEHLIQDDAIVYDDGNGYLTITNDPNYNFEWFAFKIEGPSLDSVTNEAGTFDADSMIYGRNWFGADSSIIGNIY